MTAMAWMTNLGHSSGSKAGDAVTGVRALKAVRPSDNNVCHGGRNSVNFSVSAGVSESLRKAWTESDTDLPATLLEARQEPFRHAQRLNNSKTTAGFPPKRALCSPVLSIRKRRVYVSGSSSLNASMYARC